MSLHAELTSTLRSFILAHSVCRGDFTLASGAKSDLYVDARLTSLDGAMALAIGKIGLSLINDFAANAGLKVDSVGGLTMGADPIALSIGIASALAAPETAFRVFSVRKKTKEHGRQKMIEGNFRAGDQVVIIEDVITSGGSAMQAVEAVEKEGGRIACILSLIDRQEGGRQAIEARGYQVESIFTRESLLGAA